MRHAQFPEHCRRCGEPMEVYYVEGDPHVAACPECGWTWSPEDEPPAVPAGERANPCHYEGDGRVSCADAMRSMMHNARSLKLAPIAVWWWGCAFKYVWRWPWKNGADDLRKAHDCIGRLLKEVGE